MDYKIWIGIVVFMQADEVILKWYYIQSWL